MSDFKFSCPHCAQHIQVDSQWQGRELKCPACQERLIVPPTRPVSAGDPKPTASLSTEARPFRELPLWARVTWLVVLGALSPFIVSIAMLITAVLGPLAFLVGPVLGTFVSTRRQAAFGSIR